MTWLGVEHRTQQLPMLSRSTKKLRNTSLQILLKYFNLAKNWRGARIGYWSWCLQPASNSSWTLCLQRILPKMDIFTKVESFRAGSLKKCVHPLSYAIQTLIFISFVCFKKWNTLLNLKKALKHIFLLSTFFYIYQIIFKNPRI